MPERMEPDFRPINEIQKEHLDIVIKALEGNLKIFKLFRNELSNKQQKDLLYPMVLELKNLCEECIPVFQPLDLIIELLVALKLSLFLEVRFVFLSSLLFSELSSLQQ